MRLELAKTEYTFYDTVTQTFEVSFVLMGVDGKRYPPQEYCVTLLPGYWRLREEMQPSLGEHVLVCRNLVTSELIIVKRKGAK